MKLTGRIIHYTDRCLLGEHSNRVPIARMCPVYLELRRERIRNAMRVRRAAVVGL